MHFLIVILYFLLALFGWDGWGAHTIATHAFDHGTEVLYSETSITPVLARFSCIASATGACHYRLFSAHCAQSVRPASTPTCQQAPFHKLIVATGKRAELVGLPANFTFCVKQNASPPDVPCGPELHAGLAP